MVVEVGFDIVDLFTITDFVRFYGVCFGFIIVIMMVVNVIVPED